MATYERAHHQRIAQILSSLDPALLREHKCLFGGGTAITLRYGEYRESVDMDFLVSDLTCYRELRQMLTGNGDELAGSAPLPEAAGIAAGSTGDSMILAAPDDEHAAKRCVKQPPEALRKSLHRKLRR